MGLEAAPVRPPILPVGTVTFLFTDVEGSTRLWEQHPERMRGALARHDALIEELTERHGGQVVRPRGEGDSRFCVFARASDGVAAATAMQRALHEEAWPAETPIRVRVALHTGEADLRDGDYYGSAVNRAARLRSVAHGGQALASGTTAALVRGALPPGIALRDLGEQRLKDLGEPERVYQVVAEGLPDDFPPLRSLDALPNNLPAQLTSFVGREDALADVKRLLAGARLLTMSGAGGSGKTRLALQAAADAVEGFPDGVWFVDLAPLSDPALVAATALSALGAVGADDMSSLPAETRLLEYLRAKHALLVLDNCEHVIEACAKLADAVLARCPGVRLIATSRELLGVRGETAWRVPSLTLPEPDADLTAAQLDQYEAVRLFIDRALAVKPDFAVTNENGRALSQICHRLDGIPLALELAAARVRVLSVEQIAARLNDRFRLLTGGGRTALRRQQTLQALVDWSHDLLSDQERALFRRLAVFAGGFTLEAAEVVCAGEPVEAYEVLDRLTGLVDKSLVLAETKGSEERYRLLETMRQYAEDKLLAAGEAAELRTRHAQWCASIAEALDAAHRSGDPAAVTRAMQTARREIDNTRAALTWCASSPTDAPLGMHLIAHARAGAGGGALIGVGETGSEQRQWVETFLRLVPDRTEDRANCLLSLCHQLRWHHEFTGAGAAAREAREIFEALGDEDGVSAASVNVGLVAANLGDYETAAAVIEPALARARERGNVMHAEQFTRDLGVIAISRRDFVAARKWMGETMALAERSGAVARVGNAHFRLAIIERLDGNTDRARGHLERAHSLVGASRSEVPRAYVNNLVALATGNIAREEGDFAQARELIHGALRRIRQRGEGGLLHSATCMAGMLEIAQGAVERGVTVLAACAKGEGPIGTIHVPEVRAEAPLFLERARAALGDAAYEAAWARGQALAIEDAVRIVLGERDEAREPVGARAG